MDYEMLYDEIMKSFTYLFLFWISPQPKFSAVQDD